ncbi:MAG: beta galactosidase jelly roll domain-containing protein [Ignavibacteriae bacterium]|nr:beta galactosidase jelly roll domain-containing protein [Ignavibacteriota bacterium]
MNFIIILLICLSVHEAKAENWKQLFGLRGEWKIELGDDMKRAEQHYDDSKWENIYAPSPWEDEGFPGYDGYAWYRKHFKSSSDWEKKTLALHLGNIDDVDEVYLNGQLIGSHGVFPPDYVTAYSEVRVYTFSSAYLSPDGDNVIAIRVYDRELSGGIMRGRLGVYEDVDAIQLNVQLSAAWKFKTGDSANWKEPHYNDSQWDKIIVPSFWEAHGYKEYDGFGWYRIKFKVPSNLPEQRLILLLGKIDDFDEAFLNGMKIGSTGNMKSRDEQIPGSDAYLQLRSYIIPSEVLRANQENVLAVRVYDGFKDGGMYTGPIGIVTRDKFTKWQKRNKSPESIFDWLFR